MTHLCHAHKCEVSVPPRMLFCAKHWRMLPAPAQRIVWHHYRPGQEQDKRPSAHYLLAQGVAVVLVAFLEKTWPARGALDVLAEVCIRASRSGVPVDDIEMTVRAMGCEVIR